MYVKYFDEEDAARALAALSGRFYGGVAIVAEYSPVTEFREGRCRQHDCGRGGLCNFMHLKLPTREFVEDLWTHQPHRGRSIGGRRAPSYPEACCLGGMVGGRGGGGGGGGIFVTGRLVVTSAIAALQETVGGWAAARGVVGHAILEEGVTEGGERACYKSHNLEVGAARLYMGPVRLLRSLLPN